MRQGELFAVVTQHQLVEHDDQTRFEPGEYKEINMGRLLSVDTEVDFFIPPGKKESRPYALLVVRANGDSVCIDSEAWLSGHEGARPDVSRESRFHPIIDYKSGGLNTVDIWGRGTLRYKDLSARRTKVPISEWQHSVSFETTRVLLGNEAVTSWFEGRGFAPSLLQAKQVLVEREAFRASKEP